MNEQAGQGLGEGSVIVSLSTILGRGAPADLELGKSTKKKNARALMGDLIARVQRVVAQGKLGADVVHAQPRACTPGGIDFPKVSSND